MAGSSSSSVWHGVSPVPCHECHVTAMPANSAATSVHDLLWFTVCRPARRRHCYRSPGEEGQWRGGEGWGSRCRRCWKASYAQRVQKRHREGGGRGNSVARRQVSGTWGGVRARVTPPRQQRRPRRMSMIRRRRCAPPPGRMRAVKRRSTGEVRGVAQTGTVPIFPPR